MKGTNILYVLASVWLYVECISCYDICLNGEEKLFLTNKNATAERCALKPDLKEITSLLSEMKDEITKLNAEIQQIKDTANRTSGICARNCRANAVYSSCLDALFDDSYSENGVYQIKTNTPDLYSNVYCQMTTLPGCSGGGWTLVMKMDGNKETFSYSSPYWNNTRTYSLTGGKTGLDHKEAKVATYWSTPFKQLCVGMKFRNSTQFIQINHAAKSLYDVIADGKFRQTVIPRKTWKSLIPGSSLQKNCERQGFNVASSGKYSARVRIGIIGNNEYDCVTADSFVGFGAIDANQRKYCYLQNVVNSCGNSAHCYADNGTKEVKAMGYIFVR